MPTNYMALVRQAWEENYPKATSEYKYYVWRNSLSDYHFPVSFSPILTPKSDAEWQVLYDTFMTFVADGYERFRQMIFGASGRPASQHASDEEWAVGLLQQMKSKDGQFCLRGRQRRCIQDGQQLKAWAKEELSLHAAG
jgi:hypothetical protein